MIDNPPSYNQQGPLTLDYVPALIGLTAVGAPSCATGSDFQAAIGGCDFLGQPRREKHRLAKASTNAILDFFAGGMPLLSSGIVGR